MRYFIIISFFILLASCEKAEPLGEAIYDVSVRKDTAGDPIYAVYLASSFSPNGDAINETFGPLGYGFDSNFRFEVFDRVKHSVFISTTPHKPWNGGKAGLVCPEGTYPYQFSFTDIDGVHRSYRSTVYLVK